MARCVTVSAYETPACSASADAARTRGGEKRLHELTSFLKTSKSASAGSAAHRMWTKFLATADACSSCPKPRKASSANHHTGKIGRHMMSSATAARCVTCPARRKLSAPSAFGNRESSAKARPMSGALPVTFV